MGTKLSLHRKKSDALNPRLWRKLRLPFRIKVLPHLYCKAQVILMK
nr:MAG TPA: hypothetical protein [Caudoviricetes sp.]